MAGDAAGAVTLRDRAGVPAGARGAASGGATWSRTRRSSPGRIRRRRRGASRRSRLAEVDALATELGPVYGPMIRFAAATGMRPEEWLALERQDVDRGRASPMSRGRTSRAARRRTARRRLGARGAAVARGRSRRWTTFRAARHAARVLRPPRRRTSTSATSGAANGSQRSRRPGSRSRRIYDLRSTFASNALAAGVSVFELARIMGTSVRMIERHYGALLQGSGDAIRAKLDAHLGWFGPRTGHGRGGRVTLRSAKTPRLQGFRRWALLGSNQ